MRNGATNAIFASAAALALALAGCGGSPAPSSSSTVSGIATAEEPVRSVVLRDSSVPPQEMTAETDSEGAFAFDVSALTPPFMLKAVDSSGASHYALLSQPGTVTIDALTTAAVTSALESEDDGEEKEEEKEEGWSRSSRRAPSIEKILSRLRTVLAPLFQHYGVKRFGEDMDETRAYRAMVREVGFTVKDGTFTVTAKATGAVIYSAPLNDLASGLLHPENIPGAGDGGTPTPPPPSSCTYTYSAWGACQSSGTQTRTVSASSPSGCTGGSPVLSQACTYVPPVTTCTSFTYSAWGACQSNNTQTRTVSASSPSGCTGGSPVLSQACTYVPPACSYTYSAWGACQSNSTQTRTVTASSPAGCSGTPVLSQSCTYTPPLDGAALYAQSCAGCHGSLASSNLKGKSMSVTSIKNRNMAMGLSDAQLQAVVTAVGP